MKLSSPLIRVFLSCVLCVVLQDLVFSTNPPHRSRSQDVGEIKPARKTVTITHARRLPKSAGPTGNHHPRSNDVKRLGPTGRSPVRVGLQRVMLVTKPGATATGGATTHQTSIAPTFAGGPSVFTTATKRTTSVSTTSGTSTAAPTSTSTAKSTTSAAATSTATVTATHTATATATATALSTTATAPTSTATTVSTSTSTTITTAAVPCVEGTGNVAMSNPCRSPTTDPDLCCSANYYCFNNIFCVPPSGP